MIIRSVTEGDTSRWRGDDVDDDVDDDESRLSLGSMRSTCLCVCVLLSLVLNPPSPCPVYRYWRSYTKIAGIPFEVYAQTCPNFLPTVPASGQQTG